MLIIVLSPILPTLAEASISLPNLLLHPDLRSSSKSSQLELISCLSPTSLVVALKRLITLNQENRLYLVVKGRLKLG